MAMCAELQKIALEIEQNNEVAIALWAGLTEHQLLWRPQPGRWSLSENLTHLCLTNQSYLAEIDVAIARARQKRLVGTGPFKMDWIGKMFARVLEPPYRMKMKAPRSIIPVRQSSAKEALPQFLNMQSALKRRLDAADGVDLEKAAFISPFLSLLRMNLLSAFVAITAHERRHLWQMASVREGMPAVGIGIAG